MSEIIETLTVQLENGLGRVEETHEGIRAGDGPKTALYYLAVNGLFTQMALIVQVLGNDSMGWRTLSDFIGKQKGHYKAVAANGCLSVLGGIVQLFNVGARV